jgi:hypothetical protein
MLAGYGSSDSRGYLIVVHATRSGHRVYSYAARCANVASNVVWHVDTRRHVEP